MWEGARERAKPTRRSGEGLEGGLLCPSLLASPWVIGTGLHTLGQFVDQLLRDESLLLVYDYNSLGGLLRGEWGLNAV